MQPPKKILVIALCGVGDTLSFTPHIRQLNHCYPNAQIDLMVRSKVVAEWLQEFKLCQKIWVVGDNRYTTQGATHWDLLKDYLRIILQLRRENYDLAFWPYAHTTWKKIVLAKAMKIGRTIMHSAQLFFEKWLPGFDFIPFQFTDAVIERNMALLSAANVPTNTIEIALPSPMADRNRGHKILQELGVAHGRRAIGFHPGGNVHWTSYRQWPAERFAVLADRICADLDATAILIGQADEMELLESIRCRMSTSALIVTNQPFGQLVNMVAALNGLIGNESSMVHLAGLCGIPSFSIVGPTNYHQTGPWGPQSRVVRLDLPCSPCFESGYTARCPKRICMEELTVDRVYKTILPILLDLPSKPDFKPEVKNIPLKITEDAAWQTFIADRNRWSALRA